MSSAVPSPVVTSGVPVRDVGRGLGWLLRDSWNEASRHLRAVPRNPEILVFLVIQPLMFVLLFRYVFGGALHIPGYSYVQYLVPGVFAQTVVFGSTYTGIGLAEDASKGFIDRLRSLPINPAAVLIGRTMSDLVRNLISFAVMFAVAFGVGFRFQGGLLDGVLATLLLLAFSYSFSWIQALTGLSVGSVEAANSAGFIWMFPLTFISSAFVTTATMPHWLGRVADANPFTVVTNAARGLYSGRPVGNTVWQSLAWAVGITVVFATLSVRRFVRSSR